MTQHTRPSLESGRWARDTAGSVLQNLAIQDVGAIAFHTYMLLRAFGAPDGPEAELARSFALALFTITVCTVILVRGDVAKPGKVRALFYRLGLVVPMIMSYFELRFLLPALQPRLVDLQLFAFDRMLFGGTTPALWLAQFNVRPVVEWVSFFYYSYFYLMAAMILTTLFFDRGQRHREFLMGALVVCGCGHTLYTLVPGAGPFRTLDFPAPLDGGFWWHQVELTVASAGAQLDIFPSLHTAYPVYFTIHAWTYRHERPFRQVWFIVAFFAANMVLATMFLRWHWAVDVIAGLLLAVTARTVAVAVERRERARGVDGDGRQPVWEPLLG